MKLSKTESELFNNLIQQKLNVIDKEKHNLTSLLTKINSNGNETKVTGSLKRKKYYKRTYRVGISDEIKKLSTELRKGFTSRQISERLESKYNAKRSSSKNRLLSSVASLMSQNSGPGGFLNRKKLNGTYVYSLK